MKKLKSNPTFITYKSILPAGKYFVTDPCYVFKDAVLWRKIINAFFPTGQPGPDHRDLTMLLNGSSIFMWHTTHGDGMYPVYSCDAKGNIGYATVDSGILGLIPEKFIKQLSKTLKKELNKLGTFITIETDSSPNNINGDVAIDGVEIYTSHNPEISDGLVEEDDDEDIDDDHYYDNYSEPKDPFKGWD